MVADLLDTEAFWEGVKKVGPGSEFRYRCMFDPTPAVGERPFYSADATNHDKNLLIIAGPNGSGKSSIVTSAKLDLIDNMILNPDNYARGLAEIGSESERYRIAVDVCGTLREALLQGGYSFGFETVASRKDKLEFAKRAKSSGYSVTFLFVTAGSPERSCDRIARRVAAGGHGVPEDKVHSRYGRTMAFLPDYIEIADRVEVFDNSGDGPVSVLSKADGEVTVFEEASEFGRVGEYLWNYF